MTYVVLDRGNGTCYVLITLELKAAHMATSLERRQTKRIAALKAQLRRMTDAYLIMCNHERDILIEEAEAELKK